MSKTIRSTQQIQPTNASNVVEVPLSATHKDSGGYPQTDWLPIRRVGPMDLVPGDEVLILAYEQIDNESSAPAGDPWKQTALRDVQLLWNKTKRKYSLRKFPVTFDLDPRRTLPVMVELGVWCTKSPTSVEGAPIVVKNRGTNLDNTTHHGPWEGFDTHIITTKPFSPVYYLTAVRFAWSEQFFYPGAKMEVLDRGMLSAKVEP